MGTCSDLMTFRDFLANNERYFGSVFKATAIKRHLLLYVYGIDASPLSRLVASHR